ncbi:protein of unknown function [Burkholderia multivorans]
MHRVYMSKAVVSLQMRGPSVWFGRACEATNTAHLVEYRLSAP